MRQSAKPNMIKNLQMRSTTAICSALAVCVPGAVYAADLPTPQNFENRFAAAPAVSGPNGKISAFGGGINGDGIGGVSGSYSVPFGQRFGAQFDGLIGGTDSLFYGAAVHLFTRDPAKGLFGFYASYVGWDSSSTTSAASFVGGIAELAGAEVGKVGVEAESYLGRVSLEGRLGWQYGTIDGVAGKATFAVYPTDNLRLDASFRYLEGAHGMGFGSLEWQPEGQSYSFHVGGGGSFDGDNWQATGGIRVYLGAPDKTLIRRHREDDPGNDLNNDLFQSIGPDGCPEGTAPIDIDGITVCRVPV